MLWNSWLDGMVVPLLVSVGGHVYQHAFTVTAGVRQGGVLSPVLLIVYVNVIQQLQMSNCCCIIGSQFLGCIMYADDLPHTDLPTSHLKCLLTFLYTISFCLVYVMLITMYWGFYHRPVLTATGFVNGKWQFSTPTESTPLNWLPKNLSQVITSATPTAVPN